MRKKNEKYLFDFFHIFVHRPDLCESQHSMQDVGVAIPGISDDVLIWLVQKFIPDPMDLTVLRSVSRGMRDAVDAANLPIEEVDRVTAAKRGYMTTLKYLHSRDLLVIDRRLCIGAAQNGHLEVLKWLTEIGCPYDVEVCTVAAKGGHLDTLKWAHENGYPCRAETVQAAAGSGKLLVLEWLHEKQCPRDAWAFNMAAAHGNFEVLKWLHNKGYPWCPGTCDKAAEYGHIDVLKWLRDKGCPWSEFTLKEAAKNGHHHIVRWAIANGCQS